MISVLRASKSWGQCSCNCGQAIAIGQSFLIHDGEMYLFGHIDINQPYKCLAGESRSTSVGVVADRQAQTGREAGQAKSSLTKGQQCRSRSMNRAMNTHSSLQLSLSLAL
jgi:hypothetical protein